MFVRIVGETLSGILDTVLVPPKVEVHKYLIESRNKGDKEKSHDLRIAMTKLQCGAGVKGLMTSSL